MSEENSLVEKKKFHFGEFYDKNYKRFLFVSLFLILLSFGYMIYFYNTHGDFIHKDISLTGGTSVTIYGSFDINKLETDLSSKLENINIREISDLISGKQKAIIIETTSDGSSTKKILEDYFGYSLTSENSSFEFTGSTLSKSFYNQLLLANVIAFIIMGIVVFIMFRTFVPSMAVIFSAFADILMTLVTTNILGIRISGAGIVAFLMLIGYSVDTDILLTNRVLKRTDHTVNERIFGAFKTGITMTMTSFFAVFFSLLIVRSFSATLAQIFLIVSIGLIYDNFNTWVTNASIIKWYAHKKNEI
jgi:preprotein translocase subunit SecF